MIFKGDRQLTPAITDLLDDTTPKNNKTYSSNKINNENETLNTKITNEITRATDKETELNTAITNEVTRATNKENELNTAISNEVARATTKENKLNTAITNKLNWTYVGVLSASSGSKLTVGDDWTELCTVIRVTEGTAYYNITNITPKNGFTQGSPTANSTFIGFYWNENFNAKIRLGLSGSGNSRQIKNNFIHNVGWVTNGVYVYKR